jgi:hypothetical protein
VTSKNGSTGAPPISEAVAMSRGGAWTPLGERNFRLLAAARTIDYLGNGMAPMALAFAVLDLTDSMLRPGRRGGG